MDGDEIINVNDVNYAIYKIGGWKNSYEINQIGLSSEIPVTKNTVHHIKLSMEEIRKSEFSLSDKTVNGFVAIATQLNPKIIDMDVEDIISLEKEEYDNILAEWMRMTQYLLKMMNISSTSCRKSVTLQLQLLQMILQGNFMPKSLKRLKMH